MVKSSPLDLPRKVLSKSWKSQAKVRLYWGHFSTLQAGGTDSVSQFVKVSSLSEAALERQPEQGNATALSPTTFIRFARKIHIAKSLSKLVLR